VLLASLNYSKKIDWKECYCQVLIDMIRVPDWAFEAAGQEMRGMGQDAAAYHPGLYLTAAQV